MTMKVASIQQMRAIEAAADRSLMSYEQMMLNAGRGACDYLLRRCAVNRSTKITMLIGKGNNGGDGLVMAHALARATAADVRLYLLEPRSRNDKNFQAVVADGLPITLAADDVGDQLLAAQIRDADILVDALYGIGLRLPLRQEAAKILASVKACLAQRRSAFDAEAAIDLSDTAGGLKPSAPFVLAIDCPSGIDCDSGRADADAITADATITFIAAKPGQFAFPAANHVGDLALAKLGIPDSLPALARITTTVIDRRLAAAQLPRRPLDGHKGTFGKVMLVAGSPNYIGAIALAGESACRSGVGLVTIATTRQLIDIVAGGLREPTWLPLPAADGAIGEDAADTVITASSGYDALLVGCGLGLHGSTRAFVSRLLRAAASSPLIIDADGLNILSRQGTWWRTLPPGSIITPHSGEMARLSGMPSTEINNARWQVAAEYAAQWQVVVVLKGAHTIVAAPDGRAGVIPFKTDALGTAGTGDILAGLIAGIRAQGVAAYESACLGAYVHALAGIIAGADVGSSRAVIAGDVLAALGEAYRRIAGP